MNPNKSITGALAIIRDGNGTILGRMMGVTINESYSRAEVRPVGTIRRVEAPVVAFAGSGSAQSVVINLIKYQENYVVDGLPDPIRELDANQFETQITLDAEGLELYLYKKVEDARDPVTRRITGTEVPFCKIKGLLIESMSFGISSGSLTMKDQSFSYTDPMTRD